MWDTLILNPMINMLLYIYAVLWQNYGIAIIAFTLLVRLITHPLTAQQLKSTKKLQELQGSKQWQDIQKKFKDNKEKLSQEQMKLYREAGVNPFGSCLPTLIQFPIIIGLYQAVTRALAVTPQQLLDFSSHIYPFFPNISRLIPLNRQFLWMDLSQPERLYLPFLSFGIPTLAIIVMVTTYLQSKLMTPATTTGEQGAMMGQAMTLYMPLMLGYFALTFPAGLGIYFVASNVFAILQYAALGRIDWSNALPSFLRRKR